MWIQYHTTYNATHYRRQEHEISLLLSSPPQICPTMWCSSISTVQHTHKYRVKRERELLPVCHMSSIACTPWVAPGRPVCYNSEWGQRVTGGEGLCWERMTLHWGCKVVSRGHFIHITISQQYKQTYTTHTHTHSDRKGSSHTLASLNL